LRYTELTRQMKMDSGSIDMSYFHGTGRKLIPSFPNLVAATWPGAWGSVSISYPAK
jgi:hypothetical protein